MLQVMYGVMVECVAGYVWERWLNVLQVMYGVMVECVAGYVWE